ncbi:MAG: DUF2726 domain-containing protein, partial [Gammaproteobacteria bacterium]|nr:DUF2726 domain-containing protein [Gammaproteobacteria bacterium]
FFNKVELPAYGQRISVVSPQQLALIKQVQNILQCNYTAIPGCPAYRVLDVDEDIESRSDIKKGRAKIEGIYFDLVVIDKDTFKPICVFRMDPYAHLSEEHYNEGTRNLLEVTRSVKLPMFVVPIINEYDHFKIVAHLKTVISSDCLLDKKRDYLKRVEEEERKAAMDSEMHAYDNCPWEKGGGNQIR